MRLLLFDPRYRANSFSFQRTRQSIDLVDNDGLNLAGLDVLQKPLEGRPLHRPAGQAAIVVHVAKRDPAGLTLAHDVGLTRLPLWASRELNSCSRPSSDDLRV